MDIIINMDYKLIIINIIKICGYDLTNSILQYLKYFTNVTGNGCITCKIAWNSINNGSLLPMVNTYLYPVLIWYFK